MRTIEVLHFCHIMSLKTVHMKAETAEGCSEMGLNFFCVFSQRLHGRFRSRRLPVTITYVDFRDRLLPLPCPSFALQTVDGGKLYLAKWIKANVMEC